MHIYIYICMNTYIYIRQNYRSVYTYKQIHEFVPCVVYRSIIHAPNSHCSVRVKGYPLYLYVVKIDALDLRSCCTSSFEHRTLFSHFAAFNQNGPWLPPSTLAVELFNSETRACSSYVLNRCSRIPVAQPQENEYRIPPG